MCIERQLITAVKGAKRQKHIPLNSYISLNNATFENDNGELESQLIDVLNSNSVEDPLEIITKNEFYRDFEKTINSSLSGLEKQVLLKYMQGNSYNKIAESLDMSVKSVDNAIQRIRKKTTKNMEKIDD